MILGNENNYAFKIENDENKNFKIVDIIAQNRYLSCDDNSVYLPQFISSVEQEIENLEKKNYATYEKNHEHKSVVEIHKLMMEDENEEMFSLHRFMSWGPTTDNITAFLFVHNNELILSYEFWREGHEVKEEINHVFYLKVEKCELIGLLNKLLMEIE